MKLPFSPKSLAILFVMVLGGAQVPVYAQESFRVELGRDGETLGDMRPVFLTFESRPLPAISPREVARRYQKLFESSDEPEVRIDALTRLSNIRDQSGEDVGYSEEQEAEIYEEALESYESILARGSFSGRLDELLYQMAKAHALTGQPEQSIARLNQLVGLYPNSELVPEARFRIAEAAFSAGRYEEAEAGYRQLLEYNGHQELSAKARYMLGWSQFKQGEPAWNRAAATFIAVLDQQLPDRAALGNPPAHFMDMLEDTFRVLALMASRQDGTQTLSDWLVGHASSAWVHLLYDRLGDLYAAEHQFERAVSVNEVFVSRFPEHVAGPDFLAQSVSYWQLAGNKAKALAARERYVQSLEADRRFQALTREQKGLWAEYCRFLADHYYATGTGLASRNEMNGARDAWSKSAHYYEQLAPRSEQIGELLHLAGDARLLAGHRSRAVENFQAAAYGYRHKGSRDSAWASIRVIRDNLDLDSGESQMATLLALSDEEQRYTETFGPDERVSRLRADLANRWYDMGESEKALQYASSTLSWEQAGGTERYAAWLVTARIRQNSDQYALAEQAWRQALLLVDEASQDPEADRRSLLEQLATAIYQQGDKAARAGDTPLAVAHFQRVEGVMPGSEIAIKARYDAANTLLVASEWLSAINELQRFRIDYPDHELVAETSEKLVLAYLESGQGQKAAEELLNRAKNLGDPWPTRLRAAAILHAEGRIASRNELYKSWLTVAPTPSSAEEHLKQQAIRQRLIESGDSAIAERKKLLAQERSSRWHSEDTLKWAADAALFFAAEAAEHFGDIDLVHPLALSLERKQAAMQQVQAFLKDAESFAGDLVRSEVLYRRAELYRTLASDLMNSEVPAELNEMEAMQYQMLLEEEAFPLEEEAMALHARNHERITDTGFDKWIERSLEALASMHPGRYDRQLLWMSWTDEPDPGGS